MPKKIYTGEVVSDRMQKTAVVAVTRLFQHPRYKKTVKKVTKFKVHDPEGSCRIGDKVSIVQARPISKDKSWMLLKIEEKA